MNIHLRQRCEMAVMDQTAFRQLVSSQNSSSSAGGGGGGSTNASRNPEHQSKRVFGKSQKRTGVAGSSGTEGLSSKFIPRKLGKSSKATEDEDGEEESERVRLKKLLAENYTDRAAARRSGKEEKNEFHEIEKLREDFLNRLENANNESERQQLRDQMAFLGGDAKHTVLVNGLDFALLEQQRSKMNGDNDLENAFHSSSAEKKSDKIVSKNATIAKNDKFKPIGSSKSKEEESPEYIWRNGKRMRKKRKDKGNNVADARGITKDSSSKNVETQPKRAKVYKTTEGKKEVSDNAAKANTKKDQKCDTSKPVEAPEKAAKAVNDTPSIPPPTTTSQAAIDQDKKETGAPAQDSDEEDGDIFADAGRWNGFAEEVSDEDGSV